MMKGALSGIRILDFSWGWAGPFASTLMGYMGAEVIKVENHRRVDFNRIGFNLENRAKLSVEEGVAFHDANLGKQSITLDLTLEPGRGLAYELVAQSDVVMTNLRPGVAERLGLSYKALRAVRPDIVFLYSSAMGHDGSEAFYGAYAPHFGALSGLGHLTGYEDGPATEIKNVMDTTSAAAAAFAILAAVHHRQRTGEGQWIDLSSRDVISCLIGHSFLEYTMNGQSPRRQGNRDAFMAPHNCYPCQGTDRWVSIAVGSQEEWRALCEAMGNPPWTQEPRFADELARWENQEELDRLIGAWTRERSHIEAMEIFQRHGVPAVASFTAEDLFLDPHLRERDYFQSVVHPVLGARIVTGPPWKMSATPPVITSAAPLLGQHNRVVFEELLGMAAEEVERLTKEKVID